MVEMRARKKRKLGRGRVELPTHGFSEFVSKDASAYKTSTYGNRKYQPDNQPDNESFRPFPLYPPELAKIVQLWPTLPEYIKAAIRALMDSIKTP
jgi:hypothetical protein